MIWVTRRRNASAWRQLTPWGVEWSWPKEPVTVRSLSVAPRTCTTRPPIVSMTLVLISQSHSMESGSSRNATAGPPANPSVAVPIRPPHIFCGWPGICDYQGSLVMLTPMGPRGPGEGTVMNISDYIDQYLPMRWALGWLAIAFIGFLICFSYSGGGTGAPPVKGAETIGLLIMVPALLCLAFLVGRAAVRMLTDIYHSYLAQFRPEHQEAAKAALFTGIFAAEVGVAHHMHHRRHEAAAQAAQEREQQRQIEAAVAAALARRDSSW